MTTQSKVGGPEGELNRRRSPFSRAWAALILGFAALGLTGLAFVGERAGVPVAMLRFLLTVCLLGTLLGFGVSSLIVEPARWNLAERSVRGVSAVPAMIVIALTAAWITGGALPGAAPAPLFLGCLTGVFLHLLIFGPILRRLGASSPGRMLHLRFTDWEGLPLRLLIGSVGCLLLAGLLMHILGLLAGRFVSDLALGRELSVMLAAIVIFLPAWAGGMTTLVRLSRIALAFGIATITAALLIGQSLPGSTPPALPLMPAEWDGSHFAALRTGILAALFLPVLMPVLASLSTPRSSYRLSGWLLLLGAGSVALLLWIGGQTLDAQAVERTLTSSELAPVLVRMAGLTVLAVGGGLLLFALSTSIVDDIALSTMDEPSIVPGRLLAWRRFAMIGALAGLTVLLLADQGDATPALIGKIAWPVFIAMALASYPPTLLWAGVSGIGALAGLLTAVISQIVLLLLLGTGTLPTVPVLLSDGLVCGLAGLFATIVVSLAVPPRQDARQTAEAMTQTDQDVAFVSGPAFRTAAKGAG